MEANIKNLLNVVSPSAENKGKQKLIITYNISNLPSFHHDKNI